MYPACLDVTKGDMIIVKCGARHPCYDILQCQNTAENIKSRPTSFDVFMQAPDEGSALADAEARLPSEPDRTAPSACRVGELVAVLLLELHTCPCAAAVLA